MSLLSDKLVPSFITMQSTNLNSGELFCRDILRTYAHDDVSVGSWFIGLDVKHLNDAKFCCSSWTGGLSLSQTHTHTKWKLIKFGGTPLPFHLIYFLRWFFLSQEPFVLVYDLICFDVVDKVKTRCREMVWKTLDSHPLDVCSLHDVGYEVWGKIITPIGNWFRVSCSSYEKALFPLQYTADRKDGNSTYYAYRRHSVWLYRFSCTNFREYNRVFFLQHNHSFLL